MRDEEILKKKADLYVQNKALSDALKRFNKEFRQYLQTVPRFRKASSSSSRPKVYKPPVHSGKLNRT